MLGEQLGRSLTQSCRGREKACTLPTLFCKAELVECMVKQKHPKDLLKFGSKCVLHVGPREAGLNRKQASYLVLISSERDADVHA